ncbi:chromosome partitioning protein [Nocardiopsis sp. Huas11]|uniref:ParA family protein n=1 Tax=Nocardiopsis sp. Huas11 TaxID=2183912 RepID=UPI000EB1C10D|nr:ParA family protein [Nocardiopsis sp. Huas11]RKR98970.1 chromosome partitioning protein [Nocardiopsis sp. Huas11]
MPDTGAASWIVAVCSQKGGAGKSTLVMSLAAAVADSAGRALVVDVDPQASTADEVDKMANPGFDVVHELDPARLSQLSRVREYDLILVDTPGSLEGRDVLKQVVDNSHFALLPYVDEPFSYDPTQRTAQVVQEAGVPHAAVVNRIDSRAGADGLTEARERLDEWGVPYFASFIRQYVGYPKSLAANKTVYQWRGKYSAHMREDISRVQAELQRALGRIASGG